MSIVQPSDSINHYSLIVRPYSTFSVYIVYTELFKCWQMCPGHVNLYQALTVPDNDKSF